MVFAAAILGVLVLVLVALPYADGTAVDVVFLAGAVLLIAWAGQALLAWRRAVRRRERFGQPADDGGATSVLWLAPVVVILATVFWSLAGTGASPGARAAAYAEAWWEGRAERAAGGFTTPVDPATLAAAWARQDPRLRNALVTAAAAAGPSSGIDPDHPFGSIRFSEVGPAGAAGDASRTIQMEIVKRVRSDDRLLGVLPVTTQETVAVETVGTIELELVRLPGPVGGLPSIDSWRIRRVVALGETITG